MGVPTHWQFLECMLYGSFIYYGFSNWSRPRDVPLHLRIPFADSLANFRGFFWEEDIFKVYTSTLSEWVNTDDE